MTQELVHCKMERAQLSEDVSRLRGSLARYQASLETPTCSPQAPPSSSSATTAAPTGGDLDLNGDLGQPSEDQSGVSAPPANATAAAKVAVVSANGNQVVNC